MIVISWKMLPVYAAREIGAFSKIAEEEIRVLRVPTNRFKLTGVEEMVGCPVIDVKADDPRSIVEVVGKMPRAFVSNGWECGCFLKWAKEVKRNGGKTVVMSDEAFTCKNFKHFLRKWRFKLLLNPWFDYVMVVGDGGIKHFQEYYGVDTKKMIRGLYGSDPKLFFNGPALVERPKKFIYVGHYDANKNVVRMCEAFEKAVAVVGDRAWSLEVYGGGELESELKKRESDVVHVHGFINAEELGPLYRGARGFVLGSFSDKWGVVVHEAAASGCMLLLSDKVGARYDFAREENSAIFDPGSTEEFRDGFVKLMRKSDGELAKSQETSVCLAQNFSPEIFARNLKTALGA